MNRAPLSRWTTVRQQGPTIFMVISVVSFMNARDAATAGIFGLLGMIGLAWMIQKNKQRPKGLGEPIMTLGRVTSLAPSRRSPWYALAALFFGLLCVVSFFNNPEQGLAKRSGIPLVCVSIMGTFLITLHPKLRRVGVGIFGLGFTLGGLSFAWAAVDAVQTHSEGFALEATKCAVFAAFLLLPGVATLIAALFRRTRTPLYNAGFTGPYGFVRWKHAQRLELTESKGSFLFNVEVPGGWTFLIDVDESQNEDVKALIERIINDESVES